MQLSGPARERNASRTSNSSQTSSMQQRIKEYPEGQATASHSGTTRSTCSTGTRARSARPPGTRQPQRHREKETHVPPGQQGTHSSESSVPAFAPLRPIHSLNQLLLARRRHQRETVHVGRGTSSQGFRKDGVTVYLGQGPCKGVNRTERKQAFERETERIGFRKGGGNRPPRTSARLGERSVRGFRKVGGIG